MALQGSIKDFGLPDIFQLIGLQRKTGHLTLKHDDETVTVTFENGMVVMLDSTKVRLEERLGNLLVKQGALSDERLEEVLSKQRATLQRLGHILVSNNFISQKDLQSALQVQVSQNVFRLFRWNSGDYNFEPAERVEYERSNFQPLSSDFILMEGIRMVDEWPIIEKKISSMDLVFKPAVEASMIESAGEDDLFSDPKKPASNKIRLSAEEARVFKRVDGQRNVQEVIEATGMGDFDTCKALYDLLSRDIIAPIGRGSAVEAAGASEEQRPKAAGYLLMAAAVGLAVAGAALQARTPFGVLGRPPLLEGSVAGLLEASSRARLQRLDRSLEAYRLAHGAPPRTLDALVEEGLVDKMHLTDPWSRPYHYEVGPSWFRLNAVDDAGKNQPGTTIERSFTPART